MTLQNVEVNATIVTSAVITRNLFKFCENIIVKSRGIKNILVMEVSPMLPTS